MSAVILFITFTFYYVSNTPFACDGISPNSLPLACRAVALAIPHTPPEGDGVLDGKQHLQEISSSVLLVYGKILKWGNVDRNSNCCSSSK